MRMRSNSRFLTGASGLQLRCAQRGKTGTFGDAKDFR